VRRRVQPPAAQPCTRQLSTAPPAAPAASKPVARWPEAPQHCLPRRPQAVHARRLALVVRQVGRRTGEGRARKCTRPPSVCALAPDPPAGLAGCAHAGRRAALALPRQTSWTPGWPAPARQADRGTRCAGLRVRSNGCSCLRACQQTLHAWSPRGGLPLLRSARQVVPTVHACCTQPGPLSLQLRPCCTSVGIAGVLEGSGPLRLGAFSSSSVSDGERLPENL